MSDIPASMVEAALRAFYAGESHLPPPSIGEATCRNVDMRDALKAAAVPELLACVDALRGLVDGLKEGNELAKAWEALHALDAKIGAEK